MSLLGKLMDTMRLSSEDDEDDYYLDDDFEDEAPRKGLFSKRNNTEPEDEPDAQDKPRFLGRSNPKVVPMRRNMEVTMIKPKGCLPHKSQTVCLVRRAVFFE